MMAFPTYDRLLGTNTEHIPYDSRLRDIEDNLHPRAQTADILEYRHLEARAGTPSCTERDEQVADVDVTSPGVWDRESDVALEELQRQELDETGGIVFSDGYRGRVRARFGSDALTEENLKVWLNINRSGPPKKLRNARIHAYVKSQTNLPEVSTRGRAAMETKQLDSKMHEIYSQLGRFAYDRVIASSASVPRDVRHPLPPAPYTQSHRGVVATLLERGTIEHGASAIKSQTLPPDGGGPQADPNSSKMQNGLAKIWGMAPGVGKQPSTERHGTTLPSYTTPSSDPVWRTQTTGLPRGERVYKEPDASASLLQDTYPASDVDSSENNLPTAKLPLAPPSTNPEGRKLTPHTTASELPPNGASVCDVTSAQGQPESLKGIVQRLTDVFSDTMRYKKLLRLRDSQAQLLLDAFQMVLDSNSLNAIFKRKLVVATQRLSKSAGLHPACYDLENIELESDHPVAAGSFADVYKGSLMGQDICLKAIRLYRSSEVDSFFKSYSPEAVLWSQLAHPNLLPIYGLYKHNGRPCLVSPWMDFGDVNKYLAHHPNADRSLLVLDIVSGLAYLHDNDIIHGDLKGANVLVDGSGRACLADFGLSSVSDANILHWTSYSSVASRGGTARWQAPELFDEEVDEFVHNSKASDVYAVMCVAYEIFTGNVPFFEYNRDSVIMRKVKAGARPSRPPESSNAWGSWGLTEDTWSLMQAGWKTDPDGRPSVHDIVAHYQVRVIDWRSTLTVGCMPSKRFRDSPGKVLPISVIESFIGWF